LNGWKGGSASGKALVDNTLRQVPVPEFRSEVADIARPLGSDRQDGMLGVSTDLVVQPTGNVATQNHFLQKNSSNIRNQVAGVPANIGLMTVTSNAA
jgi:hypothetical protein